MLKLYQYYNIFKYNLWKSMDHLIKQSYKLFCFLEFSLWQTYFLIKISIDIIRMLFNFFIVSISIIILY